MVGQKMFLLQSIVLVQMHFIQCKQFSETIVTSNTFQKVSDLKIFPGMPQTALAGHM